MEDNNKDTKGQYSRFHTTGLETTASVTSIGPLLQADKQNGVATTRDDGGFNAGYPRIGP
jgi:hypothetical protein